MGKELYLTYYVKYLGTEFNKILNLKQQILWYWKYDISRRIKLTKQFYDAIPESQLYYLSSVWAQNASSIKKIVFQKKSFRLKHFMCINTYKTLLLKELYILRMSDSLNLSITGSLSQQPHTRSGG